MATTPEWCKWALDGIETRHCEQWMTAKERKELRQQLKRLLERLESSEARGYSTRIPE